MLVLLLCLMMICVIGVVVHGLSVCCLNVAVLLLHLFCCLVVLGFALDSYAGGLYFSYGWAVLSQHIPWFLPCLVSLVLGVHLCFCHDFPLCVCLVLCWLNGLGIVLLLCGVLFGWVCLDCGLVLGWAKVAA